MISQLVSNVKKEIIDPVENTYKIIEKAKKINKEYNYITTFSEEKAIEQAKQVKKNKKGLLAGLPITVKDCICVKGIETSAGSKILKGYKPVFNATAINNLEKQEAIIIGKTVQDEFGFGSFNINTGLGYNIPKNPVNKEHVTGGSSGGSAGITKLLDNHASIAESTGGSIETPASFCGVIGFCPTYSRVSRYGLISYANSLDKIGPITKSISDTALLMNVISGHDENDCTTSNEKVSNYTEALGKSVKGLRIGVMKIPELDKDIDKAQWSAIKELEEKGASYEKIELPITEKYGVPAYYIIAMSEASTNLACLSGMRYGVQENPAMHFDEYFSMIRSSNFGKEAKRRIILGTFARMAGYREAYYLKATKIRTLIIQEYKKLFKKYDIIVSPTAPFVAPKLKDVEKLSPVKQYLADTLTVGPNLAGIPHMSFPFREKKGLPIGIQFMSDHFKEEKLITVGSELEK